MYGASKAKRAQAKLEAIKTKQNSAHGHYVSYKVYLERIRKGKLPNEVYFTETSLDGAKRIARILSDRKYIVRIEPFEVEKGIEIFAIKGYKKGE